MLVVTQLLEQASGHSSIASASALVRVRTALVDRVVERLLETHERPKSDEELVELRSRIAGENEIFVRQDAEGVVVEFGGKELDDAEVESVVTEALLAVNDDQERETIELETKLAAVHEEAARTRAEEKAKEEAEDAEKEAEIDRRVEAILAKREAAKAKKGG